MKQTLNREDFLDSCYSSALSSHIFTGQFTVSKPQFLHTYQYQRIQMSQEVINRVDQMIRKNNIKYQDEQSQKAYEKALREYEKHSKMELTRQYASMVKEGNKKAVEKAKEIKQQQKQKQKAKSKKPSQIVVSQPVRPNPIKKKLSQADISTFNRQVQARAERILQQQQLQRLEKQLGQEKKRTKLYQLNQKCKKMLSKSHERIVPARNVGEEKMEVLREMERKAFGEIKELDDMIEGLVDQANENKKGRLQRPKTTLNIRSQPMHPVQAYLPNEQDEYEPQYQYEEDEPQQTGLTSHFDNVLNLNTLLFQKSTDQLLGMKYIPL